MTLNVNQEGQGLGAVPDSVLAERACQRLSLAHNALTHLPAELALLGNLRVLRLDHNSLVALPESLGALINLETLQVAHNRLTTLPRSVGRLAALRHLYASHNALTELPLALHRISGLKTLAVEGNPLSFPPAHVARPLARRADDAAALAKLMRESDDGNDSGGNSGPEYPSIPRTPTVPGRTLAESGSGADDAARGSATAIQGGGAPQDSAVRRSLLSFLSSSVVALDTSVAAAGITTQLPDDSTASGTGVGGGGGGGPDLVLAAGLAIRSLLKVLEDGPLEVSQQNARLLAASASFSLALYHLASHVQAHLALHTQLNPALLGSHTGGTLRTATVPGHRSKAGSVGHAAALAALRAVATSGAAVQHLAALAQKYARYLEPSSSHRSWSSATQTFNLLIKAVLAAIGAARNLIDATRKVPITDMRVAKARAAAMFVCVAECKHAAELVAPFGAGTVQAPPVPAPPPKEAWSSYEAALASVRERESDSASGSGSEPRMSDSHALVEEPEEALEIESTVLD
ncbi:hypothetical protein H9P43_005820 [Blastocladiella emersonii ATCC 22665]|nr:hypothetical protein H9P43_005820 [Blastocladiella emersonii ATCC 22665]